MCAEPPDVFEVDNPLGSGGRDAHAYREKYPHTTGWREEKKKKRTATRGCRGRVDSCLPEIWSWQRSCRRRLADQGSSDSSSSGVVAGRRESLEPTTARRVCAACDRTRFSLGPGAGGLWPAFLGSQPRRRPRRLVPAGKEEVAGAGSRAS